MNNRIFCRFEKEFKWKEVSPIFWELDGGELFELKVKFYKDKMKFFAKASFLVELKSYPRKSFPTVAHYYKTLNKAKSVVEDRAALFYENLLKLTGVNTEDFQFEK